jgi:gp16 family phage-associated protein
MLRAARSRLAFDGDTIETWAVREGFKPKTVYTVLSGNALHTWTSLKIAVRLGLRSDPDRGKHAQPPMPPQ